MAGTPVTHLAGVFLPFLMSKLIYSYCRNHNLTPLGRQPISIRSISTKVPFPALVITIKPIPIFQQPTITLPATIRSI